MELLLIKMLHKATRVEQINKNKMTMIKVNKDLNILFVNEISMLYQLIY
jgi:hypothetical protein